MIPFIAMAAISFGIKLTVNVINFIADIQTKEDNDARQKLKQEYEHKQQEAKIQREKWIEDRFKRFSSETKQEYAKELEREERLLKKEQESSFLEMIKPYVEERLNYVDNVLNKDIDSALNTLKKEKLNCNSSLRYNSFRMLRAELEEAKNKVRAYRIYLEKYQKNLSNIYNACDDFDDILFSHTLPKEYPYQNKILFLDSKSFDPETGIGYITLHRCIKIDFFVEDYDFYKEKCFDQVVAMVMSWDRKNFRNIYSIQHGMYKQIEKSGGFTGVTAKVQRYSNRNEILLLYGKDLLLNLQAKNLYNFNRYPPIGSEITVFPIEEYYSTKENRMIYKVSQRQEDAEISLDFQKLPLILPEEKTNAFISYYNKNHLDFNIEYDDVKVAPISSEDQDILQPQKILIQFGEIFTMMVKIKSENEKQFLWFDDFVAAKKISAEDIFIPFCSEIDILYEKNFNDYIMNSENSDVFDNMNNLILTIHREFNLQHKLKNSQDGMKYFSVWENITSALKKFVEKSNPFEVEIEGYSSNKIKDKGYILNVNIKNMDLFAKYYEKILKENENSHFIPEFFIEYKKVYYSIKISTDCGAIKIFIPFSETEEISEKICNGISRLSKIIVYMKNYGIPEQRQLQALHNFKIGNLQNSTLQLYMLNGNHILSSSSDFELQKLYNPSLKSNSSQYNSLLRSMKEKNLFFIQGPPGTGKTTVIRELIAQTILKDNNAKILVVSQANVAVDNVIKGLIKEDMPFTVDDIIRCGRVGKIASEIADMSYEKKYQNYITSIQNISKNCREADVQKLSKTWLSKISSTSGYNPDVGELIIRNHKIIGATCIGLSQKKIGIDKLVFDLVIIDEAGKALAPEIVIPMIQAKKAVIIGDHKQLPAVINPALYDDEKIELDERKYCKKEIFDISYFQKLYEACPDSNKSSLDTQYRMPALIGTMISNIFYDGKLKNGSQTELKEPVYSESVLTVIDMSKEEKYIEDETSSPVNYYEANYVLYLLRDILKKNDHVKIAVITPYRGQKKQIKKLLISNNFDFKKNDVHVDTVDSFQGDEADVVIYCTTRSKKATKFLSDKRRINVAVSRTRNEFIMLASVQYLQQYNKKEPIRKVLDYIIEYGAVKNPDKIMTENCNQNIDIISIHAITTDVEESTLEEKIAYEMEHFNQHGMFSCYPKVEKKNSIFFMKENQEIYFAALRLSVNELPVELEDSISIKIKQKRKKLAIK